MLCHVKTQNKSYFILLLFFCRCRASSDCPGFLINYERESCFRVDFNTDDRRDDLIPATSRVNYFEKVCLEGKSQKKICKIDRIPVFECLHQEFN